MANYLVTGGAGFIGSNLVEYLLDAGEAVRVLDDFETGRRENLAPFARRIELIEGSLTDADACRRAVADIDYVLHQGAIPSVPRSVDEPVRTSQVNVMGTIQLLEAARAAGVRRVVYAASSSAYGDQEQPAKDEGLLPAPLSPYAAAKLAGEYFCQAYSRSMGLETVCLRYFNVFGPRQDPTSTYSAVIPLFVTAVIEGRQPIIYGDGTQSRDFTYVENNVRANILAATTPKPVAGRVINVACGASYSLLELFDVIRRYFDSEIEPEFAPPRPGDVKHSLADITLARELLGFEVTVDFHEGLRRTMEWYLAHREAWAAGG
ncbi:MAG TPA: SDR family oxidoreductase [Candidatus Sumerlaeota bacterium]|nr:MAG: UDP-glucose 4-epimerase [candidate division BRC1 bacterium ADurb.BinA292]HOE96577.1 SDR family oxidoreductase [Candidatus Sumerlaeota bacterium]